MEALNTFNRSEDTFQAPNAVSILYVNVVSDEFIRRMAKLSESFSILEVSFNVLNIYVDKRYICKRDCTTSHFNQVSAKWNKKFDKNLEW